MKAKTVVKITLEEIKKQLEQDKILESWYYFVPIEEVKKLVKGEKYGIKK